MVAFFCIFLGTIIGSFLNCLIYRLPRQLSLTNPKRSFCPKCNRSLPWFENLPVVSYLFLKGRCAGCHSPISLRYPLVEVTTAFLFWLCYTRLGFPMAFVSWIFVSLLIIATFIDLEHLLIPDEITLGGVLLGLGSSFFLPELMGVQSHFLALFYSLMSALVAYLLLWIILELGKKAFGKKCLRWEEPQLLELFKKENTFSLRIGEELLPLEELFSRSSDRIVAEAKVLTVAQKEYRLQKMTITLEGVSIPDHTWSLEEALPLQAMVKQISLPQEAMGLGDVKFLACIAAFLGMKGMLFSLFGGSIIGAITGSIILLATRGRLGRTLPFGPYLALGALLWLLFGETIAWKL